MEKYYLKYYASTDEYLVAICDIEVLGVTFKHNGVKINVNEKFYGNIPYTEEDVLQELVKASSVNAMGKNICDLLIKKSLVHPNIVIWFDNEGQKIGHVLIMQ